MTAPDLGAEPAIDAADVSNAMDGDGSAHGAQGTWWHPAGPGAPEAARAHVAARLRDWQVDRVTAV